MMAESTMNETVADADERARHEAELLNAILEQKIARLGPTLDRLEALARTA